MDNKNTNIQEGAGSPDEVKTGITINQTAGKITNIENANTVNVNNTIVNPPKPEKRIYNLYLCRKLSEALSEYNTDVKEFLEYTIEEENKSDWETKSRYAKPAFEYIVSSFGILGILLRKVIAAGNDAGQSNNYPKDYLDVCEVTALRTIQLVSFSFISKLWDYKKGKNWEFTSDQTKVLYNFFNSKIELTIKRYVELLNALVAIFDSQNIEYPFIEFNKECFQENSNFINACKNFNDRNDNMPDLDQTNLSNSEQAEQAEKNLTEILSTFVFLANYKMVAVREISYEALKNKEARYLHSYNQLGLDNEGKIKPYLSKYKYDIQPISSDAILIYNKKQKYQDGLNLFPFIIDVHALTHENEAKICFYEFLNEKLMTLRYVAINIPPTTDNGNNLNDGNPSRVEIIFNEEVENAVNANIEKDITSIKEDSKRYKELQLNTVYKVFQIAKKEILE